MIYPSRLRAGLAVTLCTSAFLLSVLVPRLASAQDTACSQVIELAERYYEQNRMQEVIALVADCLSDEAADNATAVRGYRLLALAYLRSDQLSDAKLAVIELLGRDPSYETDPIQDLPAYTALVNNIKVQLALQGNDLVREPVNPDTAVVNVTPAQPEDAGVNYRPQDRILNGEDVSPGGEIELRVRAGWSSYGGERGDSGNGFFDEYSDNGGLSLGAEITFIVAESFALGLQYQLGHYDNMLAPKGTPPEFPTIDIGDSSPWLHYIGVIGRGYVPTGSSVRPYGQVGYLATLGLINNKVEVGSGPKFAIGLDIAVNDKFGVYFEIDGHVVLPGTAVDLVDRDVGFDLFSAAGLGIRYLMAK